jgi:hypothetical protein
VASSHSANVGSARVACGLGGWALLQLNGLVYDLE